MDGPAEDDRIYTSGEVAALYGVDLKTIRRWEDAGLLKGFRTLGGHRRYRAADVRGAHEHATAAGALGWAG